MGGRQGKIKTTTQHTPFSQISLNFPLGHRFEIRGGERVPGGQADPRAGVPGRVRRNALRPQDGHLRPQRGQQAHRGQEHDGRAVPGERKDTTNALAKKSGGFIKKLL